MARMEFRVCWNSQSAHWIVQLGNVHYGAYLSKEEALLDAVDAAGEANAKGHDADVWDASMAARVF